MQKARRQACRQAAERPPSYRTLRLLVGAWFQVLFHSPHWGTFHLSLTVLSALSVAREYLALGGGPPGFPQGSTCPEVLGNRAQGDRSFSPTGLSPSMAPDFHGIRLRNGFVTPRGVRGLLRLCPTTPLPQRPRASTRQRFRLFPFRSPLLRESMSLSFPPGTEMFQFPGCRLPTSVGMTGVYPCRVSPFGHPGIKGCLRLPRAYRSWPRPSSPPGAEASTRRP